MAKRQFDTSTLFGVTIAFSSVIAGLLLDAGSVAQILQPTAALIVLGGTLGAVMVQFPLATLLQAGRELRQTLLDATPLCPECLETLIGYCLYVRRKGMLALDPQLDSVDDPFLKKALTLAVDAVAVPELRTLMEIDLDLYEEREAKSVAVFEAAGGFSPTLGIIGAVLGLIQVMQRMENVGEIGKGIAVAFVSTLYGIGFANLILLPLAGKLKVRLRERQMVREMTLDAVVAMVEGASARALRQRLDAYLTEGSPTSQPQPEPEMVTP